MSDLGIVRLKMQITSRMLEYPTRLKRMTADLKRPSCRLSGQVFISYRRNDAAAEAERLCDRLSTYFPKSHIFMDFDSIKPGADFVKAIETSVGSCDVLIAVIGKGWLTAYDKEGKLRLDDPKDIVRREIATALKRDIPVIPVLVDASMPQSSDLPEDLKALVHRIHLKLITLVSEQIQSE